MNLNHIIRENTKFALIALSSASSQVKSPIIISDDEDTIGVYSQFPFEMDETWKGWLGTLASEEISKANLVLLTTRLTLKPEILDEENQQLRETVLKLLYSLLLLGVPNYRNLYVMTGARKDIVGVRQLQKMPIFYTGNENKPYIFTEESAKEIAEIFAAIQHIYSQPTQFIQLRRGLRAFQIAITEGQDYDRLHQFVRSLDALIMSEKGEGKKQFRSRCSRTFTIHNSKTHQVLDTIYELRGRVEHLTDWDDIFPKQSEQERIKLTNQSTRQAEALARHTFHKILTSPSLLQHFKTNDLIKTFWNLGDEEIEKVWPKKERFDLESVSFDPPDY